MSLRFALYDDLHTEFDDGKSESIWTPPPNLPIDVFLFAGDIVTSPAKLAIFAAKVEREQPQSEAIIFVAGNHEFYSGHAKFGDIGYEKYRQALVPLEKSHFLEQETHTLSDGTVVVGATMWTDLSNPRAEIYAHHVMKDYDIRIDHPPYRKIAPHDITNYHRKTLQFFHNVMESVDPQKTLVMTHHAPTHYGLYLEQGDPIEALDAYGAHLDSFISVWQPKLWAHGHTHKSIDYTIGDTHVMNNPRGYNLIEDGKSFLNPDFKPVNGFTLEQQRKNCRSL